jgi:hypothetical protein
MYSTILNFEAKLVSYRPLIDLTSFIVSSISNADMKLKQVVLASIMSF